MQFAVFPNEMRSLTFVSNGRVSGSILAQLCTYFLMRSGNMSECLVSLARTKSTSKSCSNTRASKSPLGSWTDFEEGEGELFSADLAELIDSRHQFSSVQSLDLLGRPGGHDGR